MSGFAALMALSASQTKESQSSVQAALAQRQRKEEERRKQQAEFEKKEKEREAKLRLKYIEEQKRQEELKARREEEAAAKQRARERREEEERNALLYGRKKARSEYPSSSSSVRDDVRKRRLPADDDDGEMSGAGALTREEKRKRREDAEFRRAIAFGKRASHQAGRGQRNGGKLPGGAVDIMSGQGTGGSGGSSQSIKARIAAAPNTLTKLNVVKRDTRTIDEILQDRAKLRETKVLDGDDAREFNDWFGNKKKDPPKKLAAVPTPSPGANTPTNSNPSASKSNGGSSLSAPILKKIPKIPTVIPSNKPTLSKPTTAKSMKSSSISSSSKAVATKAIPGSRSAAPSRKRTRSMSMSDDSDSYASPPQRRPQGASHTSVSDEIWKLFGKDRSRYVEKDVLSDDEDMEADATALEMEEHRSTRMAKKEDEAALAEEMRHEAEKRRRKKEKELRERRGG